MEWCAAHTVAFLWGAYFSLEVSYSDIEKTFWWVHDPLPKMKNLKMNKMMTIHREIAWVPSEKAVNQETGLVSSLSW